MAKTKKREEDSPLGLVVPNEGIDPSNVFGPEHDNLHYIAERLGVRITLDGRFLNFHGETATVKRKARDVLRQAFDRARCGQAITTDIIEGLLPQPKRKSSGAANGLSQTFGSSARPKSSKVAQDIRPKNESQTEYLQTIDDNTVVFGIGPAGTGKTYLAVAAAVKAFANGDVGRIILCRPAVEAGERLGFLPGDMKDKVDPYLRPLYDALQEMLPPGKLKGLLENGLMEVAPLAFMRGRTLSNAFIILDEAQNTTREQMKMFLTRIGENSRMVITGDLSQNDLIGKESGLPEALRRLEGKKGVGVHKFDRKDVVRCEMAGTIVEAYEEDLPEPEKPAPAPLR